MPNLLTISGFSDLLLNNSHHLSGGPCSDKRLVIFGNQTDWWMQYFFVIKVKMGSSRGNLLIGCIPSRYYHNQDTL